MGLRAAFALMFALAACQTAPAVPQTAASTALPSYRFVDLSDDFLALYDRTEGQPTADRVAAFKTEIVPLFPDFYGKDRYPNLTQERYDRRIARAFESFAAQREAYRRADASFVSVLEPAIATFTAALPDMGPIGDIYLVHSLGEMDGGTREFGGSHYFIFGADVIARLHPPGSERPFFHHELFHIYQRQFFAGCEQVWCSLWTEGTAVLAAAELNPGADDAQLLLTTPQPIRAAVDANLAEAVCTVRARLQATSGSGALFSFDRLNERLPPRFGYYVGYLVAREARRTHTLQDLAHMNAAQAHEAVKRGLDVLATCPPPQ